MHRTSDGCEIERWGVYEIVLDGPSSGNPYIDVSLSGQFTQQERTLEPEGFFDGDGVYRIRFMPDSLGVWHYETVSNITELDGLTGQFTCVEAKENVHGPVRVHNTFHFTYADGTPYYPFGTTCYAWVNQVDELEEQTLATLAEASFNKIRMSVFPFHYPYITYEPVQDPFVRDENGENDYSRFNPDFFRHFEKRLTQLAELGIEADIIIWHPYDRWGYSGMGEEDDCRYLRYLIARLAAYHNVWWSLANEYDFLLKTKPMELWDRFFEILIEKDPYAHLRSIHNGYPADMYDHTKPGVSHVCIQHPDIKQVVDWRQTYGKPIVNDELEYEGNLTYPWGGISAEEEVHRFWIMVTNGGYAGHGETYTCRDNIIWWSVGGILRGESWKRIGFLRSIIENLPDGGLTPLRDTGSDIFGPMTNYFSMRYSGGSASDSILVYFEDYQPTEVAVWLPDGDYEVDLIDTWNMTISPATVNKLNGFPSYSYDTYSAPPEHGDERPAIPSHEIILPGKPRLAMLIRKT